jgi:hypothetical protein
LFDSQADTSGATARAATAQACRTFMTVSPASSGSGRHFSRAVLRIDRLRVRV